MLYKIKIRINRNANTIYRERADNHYSEVAYILRLYGINFRPSKGLKLLDGTKLKAGFTTVKAYIELYEGNIIIYSRTNEDVIALIEYKEFYLMATELGDVLRKLLARDLI